MAEKLRANTERLYASVVVGMMRFGKEIDRIRNWKEGWRSMGFLTVRFDGLCLSEGYR
jgi:hypothetical protein